MLNKLLCDSSGMNLGVNHAENDNFYVGGALSHLPEIFVGCLVAKALFVLHFSTHQSIPQHIHVTCL